MGRGDSIDVRLHPIVQGNESTDCPPPCFQQQFLETYQFGIKSLFPRLHFEHRVCKFSITVSPPFDQGMIWSICSSTDGSFAGEAPQAQHLKLSRDSTLKRNCKLMSRLVLWDVDSAEVSIFVLSHESSCFTYETNCSNAIDHFPNLLRYAPLEIEEKILSSMSRRTG